MDMFQLKYFVSAASIGNFTLASYENSISQSSFSKQIMSLENELGVKLFERKKKKYHTDTGRNPVFGICLPDVKHL